MLRKRLRRILHKTDAGEMRGGTFFFHRQSFDRRFLWIAGGRGKPTNNSIQMKLFLIGIHFVLCMMFDDSRLCKENDFFGNICG